MADRMYLVRFMDDGRMFTVVAGSKHDALDKFEQKFHPQKGTQLEIKERGVNEPWMSRGVNRTTGRASAKLARAPKTHREIDRIPVEGTHEPMEATPVPSPAGPQLPHGPLQMSPTRITPPRTITQQPAPTESLRSEVRKIIREEIRSALTDASTHLPNPDDEE